jgi:hypothetical protein
MISSFAAGFQIKAFINPSVSLEIKTLESKLFLPPQEFALLIMKFFISDCYGIAKNKAAQ